ncbi:hypothetical protein AYI68_g6876, partial [Smittium mucronatum]
MNLGLVRRASSSTI